MRRNAGLARGGRIKPVADSKRAAKAAYTRDAAYYLARHPYCQIFIFRHELDEKLVIALGGNVRGLIVPKATQIHHRNKRNTSERLLDQRWWMGASAEEHEWVERHKDEARELGLLLPIQASPDGVWGTGNRALPTEELLLKHARP